MKHSASTLRLLLVTEFYPPHVGGVEVAFQNLAKRLVAAGHDVTVVTSRVRGTLKNERMNGVRIRRVWVPPFLDRYFFTFLSLWCVIRLARKIDLIQTTTINALFPGWVASKLWRKPAVLMVHEIYGSRWRSLFGLSFLNAGLHRFLERFLLLFPFNHYVAVSHHTADDLKRYVSSHKISVIHHGIDEDIFDRARYSRSEWREKFKMGNHFVYLFFGRAGVSKGLEHLLRAVPEISRKIPNSRLMLILSKKPKGHRERMLKLIDHLGIKDSILLHDSLPIREVAGAIVASDGVVIPSLAEGFGFAAAEACALGVPVVVSRAASLPEVVSGNVIFTRPGEVKSLVDGVEALHRKLWDRIPPKTFSWDTSTERYLEIYKSLIR